MKVKMLKTVYNVPVIDNFGEGEEETYREVDLEFGFDFDAKYIGIGKLRLWKGKTVIFRLFDMSENNDLFMFIE